MTHFIQDIKRNSNKYNVFLFSLMALAFSIPFGDIYARMLFPFILLSWLPVVNKKDIINLFKNRVVIIFSLYIIVHIISLLWSEHIEEGVHFISRMIRYSYLPLIIIASSLQKKDTKYIITAFVLGMFINEIISYLIYFNLYQTEYSRTHNWPVGFINHIPYSVLAAFTAILILFQAKQIKNTLIKSIYLIFFITMTTNLVISGGRTGYIVYFGCILILLFSFYQISLRNFIGLLIFPTIVFISAYNLDASVQSRISASFSAIKKIESEDNFNSSLGARLAFYPMVYDILKQPENSFIWGSGTGDIYYNIEKSTKRTKLLNSIKKHLHNSYLTAYVNTGIPGLYLLILLLISIWKVKTDHREADFIKQLMVLSISISIFSDVILSIKATMIFFSVFCAITLTEATTEPPR